MKASSNLGDLVLDAYAGSGTTLAAAAENGRNWIGIDESPAAITTAIERLVLGTPMMGTHARNDYVLRDTNPTRQIASHAFRVFVDDHNPALSKTTIKTLRQKALVPTFKPIDSQSL